MFNGFHTMGAGGWLLMALLWAALLMLVVWLVARLFPTRADARPEKPAEPRKILDQRLASGEIDTETYEELRSKLGPRSLAGTG